LSYNHILLFESISKYLDDNPRSSIRQIARELKISRRTIQEVIFVSAGKSFSALREELMMEKLQGLFVSQPGLAIKEVSFIIGFYSPRSFGRAVKRACGFSPQELRSYLVNELKRTSASAGREEVSVGR
jgi:transcriptional regulator GlxA family with amidase domain